MNVRKPADYGTIYRKLTAILPQMDEVYAISKAISQRPEKGAAVAAAEFLQANFPDRTGFFPVQRGRMRNFTRLIKRPKAPMAEDKNSWVCCIFRKSMRYTVFLRI